MRFFSHHRRFEQKTRLSRGGRKYGHLKDAFLERSCSAVQDWLFRIALVSLWFSAGAAGAQPPGTTPTRDVFSQQQDGVDASGLPIRAFMFLSESDNVVLMPGLSWEEFERLSNPDSVVDSNQQLFSFQSLAINGEVDAERFEGQVALSILVAPSQGQWIRIPLQMGNFHRLKPPEVTGIENYFMTLTPDGSGHLLLVKTDQQQELKLRMEVSARVVASTVAKTLEFKLPGAPSRVDLTVGAVGVEGEVLGRGDEVLETKVVSDGGTKFQIESGGGNYLLRWGSSSRTKDDTALLEVESRINVRWDSPQDPLIADFLLTVENVRGSIDSFQLRLPPNAVVLDSLRLGDSGRTIDLGEPVKGRDEEIRDVIIPEAERGSRIDLSFELQLSNDNASESNPLGFHVAEVVGSLRHRGVIAVETGSDYRLRWLSSPWVDRVIGELGEDTVNSGRKYEFRFERASFELPLYLGEKGRQLRMTSNSILDVYDSAANLDMTISINGQVSKGLLQFNDAGWQIREIQDSETGELLDLFEDDDRFLNMRNVGNGDLSQIRILAELQLEPENGDVGFYLPTVTDVDGAARVQKATLDINSTGRSMMVVDLAASVGLTRGVVAGADVSVAKPSTISYQIQTQEKSPKVVGALVAQPPRISLASEAAIELSGNQLRTDVDWTVTSSLDLEGSLFVRIPDASGPATLNENGDPIGSVGQKSLNEEPEAADGAVDSVRVANEPTDPNLNEPWVVSVNGAPAKLRYVAGDRYELISERLAMNRMDITWRRVQDLNAAVGDGAVIAVPLPSPGILDVTIRGSMGVTLRGDQGFDLVSADRQRQKRLDLVTFPRDPLRLKLLSRLTSQEELTVQKTVLRTVVGRNLRHESVYAKVQGGGRFQVGLPSEVADVSVQAFIDGEGKTVRREKDTLVVLLPNDSESHVVDLQVWIARETPASYSNIKPLLRLPFGVGRVYWQIVAPSDGHVLWASPTLGRSMSWRFDRWKLYRQPTHDDVGLLQLVDATSISMPPGNRYLYIGSDLRSFEVVIVSRVVLWVLIGSVVLLAAVVLTNLPKSRHPLTAVVLAVMFGGLLAIAPDAAVLAGQFGIIALVLVIVMIAVRVLVSPATNGRVFSTSVIAADQLRSPSTRSLVPARADEPEVTATEALPEPAPTEVTM
ncbi:MAG: hypothetical protein CMM01_05720 [Rhodopirellula sp.]|nr:hypothetical protein [Rhodopirellula sp.]OUX52093.1 MAG: hypothetical protein CBE43_01280 [Rhodopirellula sp. TMED283]